MSDDFYWHFLPANCRTRYSDELVQVGTTLRYDGRLRLCRTGLHASERAIDALGYAPGPVACAGTLGRRIVRGDDKVCSESRTVVAMEDVSLILYEFACSEAERAVAARREEGYELPDVVDAAIAARRGWLIGEVFDSEVAAAARATESATRATESATRATESAVRAVKSAARVAWSAAWGAAESAAWAAESAAYSAAESAAWGAESAAYSAAESAAWDDAWNAAYSAARTAQNERLERVLRQVLGL